MRFPAEHRSRFVATGAALLLSAIVHGLSLLNWSTKADRTANPLGYASNFFDYQARAFMDGHLYVPDGSLGIEAFRVGDHDYMYFGPFPALLRIPVLWTTPEFDGRLTVASMAVAFVVLCVMATRLLWLVRDLARPGEPVGRIEATVLAIVLTCALAGTSLTFNAALPWVYHEVYAWAVALAVGCLYWLVRVSVDPSRKSIGWLAFFVVALVLTRTPGGFAMSLGALALAVVLHRRSPALRRTALAVGLVGVGALAVGVTVNMLKFGHPYLFPLEDQVWTQLNAHRREALRVNGGTITGPQFFTSTFMAYFRLDGIRFVDYFPFVTFPAEPAQGYDGAFIDQSYRTGSVTAFMPMLLVLALASLGVLFRRRAPRWTHHLRIPVLSAVLITGAVMNYGYIAYRYASEFVPALIIGAFVTAVPLAGWLQRRGHLLRGVAIAALTLATAYSVAIHLLVGFATAAMTSPGTELSRYLRVQHAVTPEAQARLVTRSDDPPSSAAAPDTLHVEGDCDALYVETGEQADRWLLAERRSLVVVATIDPDARPTDSILVEVGTDPRRWVRLQTNKDGQARVVLEHENGKYPGPWVTVPPPYEVRIGVRDLPDSGYAEISSTPGGFVGYLRSFSWGTDWQRRPIPIEYRVTDDERLAERGVRLRTERGLAPVLCEQLLDEASAAR